MKKLFSVLLLSALFVNYTVSQLHADKLNFMAKSLVGIRGLDVYISIPEKDLSIMAGLIGEEDFKTLAELKLRMAGIDVEDDFNPPILLININALEPGDGTILVYEIDMHVWQKTTLVRDPTVKLDLTTTWFTGTFGTVPRSHFADATKTALGGLMDGFLNDYLNANPR